MYIWLCVCVCHNVFGVLTFTMVETGWIRFMFLMRLSVRSATLSPMAQLV